MKNLEYFTLITGAGGLLGRYHAEALLEIEENILLTDISVKKLLILKKSLCKSYSNKKILIKKLDVTSEKSITNLLKNLN